MYRSEANKRRCAANNYKCMNRPWFFGLNVETGATDVACFHHALMLTGDKDTYGRIKEDPISNECPNVDCPELGLCGGKCSKTKP